MTDSRPLPTTNGTPYRQPDTRIHMGKNVRLVRNGYPDTRSFGAIA